MKIKISEAQAKRLKLVNENVDVIGQFEHLCQTTIQEVNKIYLKVINIAVSDILDGQVKIQDIYQYVDRIENKILDADKKAYAYIAQLPEADLDLRIDNAASSVTDKITALQLIIMGLEKIEQTATEHNLKQSFVDAKPLEVQPS